MAELPPKGFHPFNFGSSRRTGENGVPPPRRKSAPPERRGREWKLTGGQAVGLAVIVFATGFGSGALQRIVVNPAVSVYKGASQVVFDARQKTGEFFKKIGNDIEPGPAPSRNR